LRLILPDFSAGSLSLLHELENFFEELRAHLFEDDETSGVVENASFS